MTRINILLIEVLLIKLCLQNVPIEKLYMLYTSSIICYILQLKVKLKKSLFEQYSSRSIWQLYTKTCIKVCVVYVYWQPLYDLNTTRWWHNSFFLNTTLNPNSCHRSTIFTLWTDRTTRSNESLTTRQRKMQTLSIYLIDFNFFFIFFYNGHIFLSKHNLWFSHVVSSFGIDPTFGSPTGRVNIITRSMICNSSRCNSSDSGNSGDSGSGSAQLRKNV